MEKLRLDYFLSLGLKLVNGDVYSFLEHPNRPITVTKAHTITNCPSESDKTTFIESFAWNSNFNSDYFNQPNELIHVKRGVLNYAITHWRYNIDELIKMQSEHDKVIKTLKNKPQVDEKCRVEYSCPEAGKIISDFTFKFETAADYTGLDKFGHTDVIPKRWFIAWHPIDERSELDIAKEAQITLFSKASRDNGFFINERYLKFMQEQGMLCEILLPLKK